MTKNNLGILRVYVERLSLVSLTGKSVYTSSMRKHRGGVGVFNGLVLDASHLLLESHTEPKQRKAGQEPRCRPGEVAECEDGSGIVFALAKPKRRK